MSQGHDSRQSVKNNHTSYERYKAKLHAIFDGKAPLPTHIKEVVELKEPVEDPGNDPKKASPQKEERKPAPVAPPKVQRRLSPSQNTYSLFSEALKKASTHEEMKRAVSAFREAKLPLPSDEDLLSKALSFPEEEVVLELLDQLESLLRERPSKNPRLLASRLEDAAFLSHLGAARDRIQHIKAMLKA